MTGTCSRCFHFSDDVVLVREGELICRECMEQFGQKIEDDEE